MLNYIYYLFGAGVIGTVGLTIYYYINPEGAEDLAQQATWNTVRCYHKVKHNVKKINKKFLELQKKQEYELANINIKYKKNNLEKSDDIELNKNNIEFIGYKLKDDTTFTTYDFDNEYIYDNTFDLMFLKKEEADKNIYKRITTVENLHEQTDNFDLVQKPFVQIELDQNNNKTSIHKKLENFYVKGNTILDKAFLAWFMRYKYYIQLNNNYELNIIDSNINMFKLDESKSIKLLRDSRTDVYKID